MVKKRDGFLVLEAIFAITLLGILANLLIHFIETRANSMRAISEEQRELQSLHDQNFEGRAERHYIFNSRSEDPHASPLSHRWVIEFGDK